MSQESLFTPESGLLRTYSGATFSPCRRYRYTLYRVWDTMPVLAFVMLNPSTADEVENDPTVERCERRARMWGYGGVVVTNIFAWRSTDPNALYGLEDPIGPDNDKAIVACARYAGMVICAWGNHGKLNGRGRQVREMLAFRDLHYLKLNINTGECTHPLYLSFATTPKLWKDECK
jgi:hypothetical protein